MRKVQFVIISTTLFGMSAFAQQQQPDPIVMQRAMNVLQAQRNQALDQGAAAEVRSAGLADELSKAQAKIKELEEKVNAK